MTGLHVPRIFGIVGALVILSYANKETQGLLVALVVVALVSLALTPGGNVRLAGAIDSWVGGLGKVVAPPVTPRPVLPGHEGGPPR